ncbi:MAG TPA: pyruvate kinase [Deltaproteobacteria bacterium]|nr:pyruvate kinase [Deltaproteobacteria bacterium]
MRRTKTVCTLGPSSETPEIIEGMIRAGMNVARLNFSHGRHADHGEKIKLIRELSEKLNRPIAILQDLAGPKIRIGKIPEPGLLLQPGEDIVLTTIKHSAGERRIFVAYETLPDEVKPGDRLLLADALLELTVMETRSSEILCRVVTGGLLTSNKGINLPTGTIRAPAVTEKDKEDLLFGLKNGVDYVAVSFVKTAEDILSVREIIRQQKKDTPVVAKIEKHEAVDNLDDIMAASDGVMVARGDLGADIPLEDVPLIQKKIIKEANARGKFVITATQMLRSMVESPRPTRAEATDVANAVLDGTDAVMLSEETASGNYPIAAIIQMDKICRRAETVFPYRDYLEMTPKKDVSESVAHAACVLADHLDARIIVSRTLSGATARFISRFRPRQPVLALSPDEKTVRRLALIWGCFPHLTPQPDISDHLMEEVARKILPEESLTYDDLMVMTLGQAAWQTGSTNILQVKQLFNK